MAMTIFIYILIFYFIIAKAVKSASSANSSTTALIYKCFKNAERVYSTSSMQLYKGDRAGENFIIALKNSYTTVSVLDLTTINDVATKYHIHSKVLISNSVDNTSVIGKKLKEYEIQVWTMSTLVKLANQYSNSDEMSSLSPLSTSNTSDDDCEISDANDPIQDGLFNTHGIFSLFNNKPDRL